MCARSCVALTMSKSGRWGLRHRALRVDPPLTDQVSPSVASHSRLPRCTRVEVD